MAAIGEGKTGNTSGVSDELPFPVNVIWDVAQKVAAFVLSIFTAILEIVVPSEPTDVKPIQPNTGLFSSFFGGSPPASAESV